MTTNRLEVCILLKNRGIDQDLKHTYKRDYFGRVYHNIANRKYYQVETIRKFRLTFKGVFWIFFGNSESRQFCFVNFSMNMAAKKKSETTL